MTAFSDMLRYLKKQKEINLRELAEAMGVSESAACKWHTGANEPDVKRIMMLADYFGCSVDYLFGICEHRHPNCDKAEYGLNDLADKIHDNAIAHGWWDESRSFPEIIALCHSELSEALEEYREEKPDLYYCNGNKPEGIGIELADCIIRILDYCGKAGIDIEGAIRIKHEYNKTRPYKHGGKKC